MRKTEKKRHKKRQFTLRKKHRMSNNITQKKYAIVKNLVNKLNNNIKEKLVTIGVVSSPFLTDTDTYINSYLPSDYVKWLQSSGALIVPLEFNLPKEVLLGFLKQLNGVVFIGGSIDDSKHHNHKQFINFQETVLYIMNYIKYENEIGNYYPVWNTCMGFEMGTYFSLEDRILKSQNDYHSYLIDEGYYGGNTLQWTNQPSKMKKLFSSKDIADMNKEECVFYAHSLSLPYTSEFTKKFSKIANIVATGVTDKNKIKYIAAWELKSMPIYGTQFHPEKIQFEYVNDGLSVPKNNIAIKLSSKLSRFFISECKKNSNVWIGGRDLYDFTINNYNLFNRFITSRFKHLKAPIIHTSYGDAGDYLFGSEYKVDNDIIENPWPVSDL